jgi:SAM-dependent methyltransferase
MDLRKKMRKDQVGRAKSLALRGLLNYQPFVFSDDLAVGAGMNIIGNERLRKAETPSIWCSSLTPQEAATDYAVRQVARPEVREDFLTANERMRRYYDDLVDKTEAALGSLKGFSTLDVGCCSGYFPISFALRGAKNVVGMDRVDYSQSIGLLNEICGTRVQFRMHSYDGSIKSNEQFDLVSSIAVLCHLSDPLQHLSWLGSSARKALLVFTPCDDVDNYSIRFRSVNRYYQDDFPYCFDMVTLSRKLLRLAMERMGFTKLIEIPVGATSMPADWQHLHLGLLGIREGDAGRVGTRQAMTTVKEETLAAKFLRRSLKIPRAILQSVRGN